MNEIVGSTFTLQPAGTLAYYSALEASGADHAAHSCWPDSTGVSACINGTLDGLLTNSTFQPRAAWWLHKSYADGVGARVQSVTGNPGIVALASSTITGAATPQILIGNFNFEDTVSNTALPANVTLSMTNLQALAAAGAATNIDVQVELIPNTGEAAVSQLAQVAEMNASIKGGAAQVLLPPLQVGEVFRVTLVPPAPQVATITSGGVVDPWNYAPGAAPRDWVTIFGVNLGPAVPQSWNPPPGATLPTSLGGVSVGIAGTPAVLSYVSSSQINALIPANTPPGTNQVVVTVNGVVGNPYELQVDPTNPVIYSVPSAAQPGNFYVTAALGGTAYLIGTPGVDPGVTRGAYPGDLVDLYMIGLGATQDPALFITNQLFAEAAPIAATVQISLGGQIVSPTFAGLISPGLYLVRFNVPTSTTPGDLPIFVSVNGNSTHGNVYFTISPN